MNRSLVLSTFLSPSLERSRTSALVYDSSPLARHVRDHRMRLFAINFSMDWIPATSSHCCVWYKIFPTFFFRALFLTFFDDNVPVYWFASLWLAKFPFRTTWLGVGWFYKLRTDRQIFVIKHSTKQFSVPYVWVSYPIDNFAT